jgi:protein-S-isoprenylcysteine O-methyltransferase Ste14
MSGSDPEMSGPPPLRPRTSIASLLPRLLALLAILAVVLFLSAGRLNWAEAWWFVLAYGGFLLVYGVWGLRKDPGQMAERSRLGRNVKTWDKTIMAVYTVLLLGMLVLAGLDAGRFAWSSVPPSLQAAGWVGLLFAGAVIWWAASANTFLSRMVRIQDDRGHRVVAEGPYRWIRHPMYAGLIVFILCVPLVLGSCWALVPGVLIGILFAIRTALEDQTLREELSGYRDYAQRVRYRLIPWVW